MGAGGFRTLTTARRYHGKLLNVDRLEVLAPDGTTIIREMVSHPGSAAVLPYDGASVILIRQMRLPAGSELLEIPAGLLDEPDEDPMAAAARECEEEVGYRPGRMTLLARFYNTPGYSDELTHLYLAEDLERVGARPASAEERAAQIVTMPLADALAEAVAGNILDAKTVLALTLGERRLRSA